MRPSRPRRCVGIAGTTAVGERGRKYEQARNSGPVFNLQTTSPSPHAEGVEVVMTRWIALAVVVALAAGLPRSSCAQRVMKPDASAGRAVFDARRHVRY